MAGLARNLLSRALAASLALTSIAPTFAAPSISRQEYEACQARDDQAFRTAIETVTVNALRQGVTRIDFAAIVADEWRRGGLDEIIDKRVDLAVAEIRDETSWANLLQSLADKDKAQALATAVAERVYRSDALKTAIEGLAVGVGKEAGRHIEIASQDAAEPTVACLKAFLGPRYGSMVAGSVSADAGKEMGVDPSRNSAEISSGAVLKESSEGIAGAAVLLVRRQLANMAGRIGQRLVGAVLSRLVSVVAGGVGLVLIAKDLWELRHGVLPIIATEMKAKSTKDKVQEELAKTLSEQIGEHVKEIGQKTSERVVEIWQDFRRAHAKALDLSEKNDDMRQLLDRLKADQLPRLDEVVGLLLQSEGESGLLRRLKDGSLAEAVTTLPAAALDIAREARSLEAAMKWHALAPDKLPRVLDLELHKRANPDELSRASLARILDLNDRLAITRIAALKREARDQLFDLDSAELTSLARNLTEGELDTLARYLTGLEKAPREKVLKTVAANPSRMQVLASARVRDAILASSDQAAAVAMMLRPEAGFDPNATLTDLRHAWGGRVHPVLIWEKHPVVVGLFGLAAVLLLLLLRRLVSRPRAATPPAPPPPAEPAKT